MIFSFFVTIIDIFNLSLVLTNVIYKIVGDGMSDMEYLNLISETYKEMMRDFSTLEDKIKFKKIFLDTAEKLL